MVKEDDLSPTERKEVVKEINKRAVSKEKVASKARELKNEFKKQLSTAIIAAFGLIIALAWRDVINDYVSRIAFVKEYGLLITALIMTIVSVIGIFIISQWSKSEDKK